MRQLIMIAALLGLANGLWAQSIEDGLKDLYYNKYQSAKQTFEKIVASKPDERAYYYLGMAELGLENTEGAAAAFQKGLQAVPNSPLLQVGLGRIDLINGNAAAAKQKFEAASQATQGTNAEVARAIADANTEVKGGDRGYALSVMEKLLNNPDAKGKKKYTPVAADYIELGDAYRLLGGENGGKAITTYDKALELEPNRAEAVMKQGQVNFNARLLQEAVNDWTKATTMDPNYGPAYYELYQFYITPTKNTFSLENAAKFLQRYMEVVGTGAGQQENEYNLAAISFYKKDYDAAISKAQSVLPQANDAYKGKFTRLIADAYLQKGDSLNAQKTMDEYVKTVPPEKLETNDYKMLSNIYTRLKSSDSAQQAAINKQALTYLEKYAEADTTRDVARYEDVARAYANAEAFDKAAEWYQRVIGIKTELKETPTAVDYYNVGQNFFRAAGSQSPLDTVMLNRADSAFGILAEKFPDITTGHYWRGYVNAAKDELAKTGAAVPYFEKYLSMAEGDPAKNKVGLVRAYTYIMVYYYNKDDKTNLQTYMNKLLAIDPDNQTVKQIKENLSSTNKSQSKPGAGTRSSQNNRR
ncbi:tetratricopeptide repeat protein [uncultured Chitinophaga sp.]|jgi:Predicted N-acetylglucosaminyl transferase|uniref:tetratricopeptide repeat protein n=1 Tax=uncultured Chitinophaga sp. TaxID=339340 RepID=UPI002638CD3B|nr:tetratricopeptide repeat protein [uncultured Chitinophaga sp.]